MARLTAVARPDILHNNYTGGRSIYNIVAIKINTQFGSFCTRTELLGFDKANLALSDIRIALRSGGSKNFYSSYKPPLCTGQIKMYCLCQVTNKQDSFGVVLCDLAGGTKIYIKEFEEDGSLTSLTEVRSVCVVTDVFWNQGKWCWQLSRLYLTMLLLVKSFTLLKRFSRRIIFYAHQETTIHTVTSRPAQESLVIFRKITNQKLYLQIHF